MLMLLCIQVVQINDNESDWREKKRNNFLMQTSQKKCELAMKAKKFNS
jgi:hypothetical protein